MIQWTCHLVHLYWYKKFFAMSHSIYLIVKLRILHINNFSIGWFSFLEIYLLIKLRTCLTTCFPTRQICKLCKYNALKVAQNSILFNVGAVNLTWNLYTYVYQRGVLHEAKSQFLEKWSQHLHGFLKWLVVCRSDKFVVAKTT